MFSKSKKPENKDMVVAPVPIPPKDTEGEKSAKQSSGSAIENKVFTKVAPSVLSSDLKVKGNQQKMQGVGLDSENMSCHVMKLTQYVMLQSFCTMGVCLVMGSVLKVT